MQPRICICCGEPIAEHGHTLSRNPNMCASCSSLADGMEEQRSTPTSGSNPEGAVSHSVEPPKSDTQAEEKIVECAAEPNRQHSG